MKVFLFILLSLFSINTFAKTYEINGVIYTKDQLKSDLIDVLTDLESINQLKENLEYVSCDIQKEIIPGLKGSYDVSPKIQKEIDQYISELNCGGK